MNYPIGTRLFFVPIRYWEDHYPIETGYIAGHTIHPDDVPAVLWNTNDVYAFHDGYGHNVYMQTSRVFLTLEDAINGRKVMIKVMESKEKEEMEFFMSKIFVAKRKD